MRAEAVMPRSDLPLILIEGVLVFGGALAFGWWQLRSVERDRQALLRRRADEAAALARAAAAEPDAAAIAMAQATAPATNEGPGDGAGRPP